MKRRTNQIDFVKMLLYILHRLWLIVLCAELGFGALYTYDMRRTPESFTASGRMYVYNVNPNLSEYQYTSGDLYSSVRLINTYLVVVRSDKVMNAVVEQLSNDYPEITVEQISPTLSMSSVSETGVVSVISTTGNAQMSADIVNAVMEYAPEEIIRVVGAGSVEIIDYAKVPVIPDAHNTVRKGLEGAAYGAAVAACILVLLFMMNRRVSDIKDLTENYTPPVLASLKRVVSYGEKPDRFLLSNQSPMEIMESYAKLRMNLLYTLVGKESHTVVVTSSISGEGKTTIAANLAISCAMGGKKVLLIDGDLRRACQRDIFEFDKSSKGLSDILVGSCAWQDAIIHNIRETLDLLPAGHLPPNPAELLESRNMLLLEQELEKEYELILVDMPPINIVADPLIPSTNVAGCIFVIRQNFTDHRDIRRALIASEMTGMKVLGFVFYGERINQGGYYSRRYYRSYYNKYDYRRKPVEAEEPVQPSAALSLAPAATEDSISPAAFAVESTPPIITPEYTVLQQQSPASLDVKTTELNIGGVENGISIGSSPALFDVKTTKTRAITAKSDITTGRDPAVGSNVSTMEEANAKENANANAAASLKTMESRTASTESAAVSIKIFGKSAQFDVIDRMTSIAERLRSRRKK